MGGFLIGDLLERLDRVRDEAVAGDLVECGTGRGGGGIFLRTYLEAHEMRQPRVWIADTFRSAVTGKSSGEMPYPGAPPLPGGGLGFPELQGDLQTIRDGFARFGAHGRERVQEPEHREGQHGRDERGDR